VTSKNGNRNSRPIFDDGVAVIISAKCCYNHGELCVPSPKQLEVSRSRSGAYSGSINELALFTLCNLAKNNNGRIKSQSIKTVIAPFWPRNKNVTSHDVFNIRRKITKMLPKFVEIDGFEAFKTLARVKPLVPGIDNEPLTSNDQTSRDIDESETTTCADEMAIDDDLYDNNDTSIALACDDNNDISTALGSDDRLWEAVDIDQFSNNAVKPLSSNEIAEMIKNISYKYSTCSDETKFAVGALVVSLEKLVLSDGKCSGFESSSSSTKGNNDRSEIMTELIQMVKQYKQKSLLRTSAFNHEPVKEIAKPSPHQLNKQSRLRIRNSLQMNEDTAQKSTKLRRVINTEKEDSCTFCGGKNHKIPSCMMKKQFADQGNEYILSKKHQNTISQLKERFTKKCPIIALQPSGETVAMARCANANGRNILVHKVLVYPQVQVSNIMSLESLLFEVSYISNDGEVRDPKVIINGEAFHSMISVCSSKTKMTYLYDCTVKQTPNFRQIRASNNINMLFQQPPMFHYSTMNFTPMFTTTQQSTTEGDNKKENKHYAPNIYFWPASQKFSQQDTNAMNLEDDNKNTNKSINI
jgi:hypothetical protein